MSKRFHKILSILALFTFTILTGCEITLSSLKNEHSISSIQETIDYLSSEKLEGRLVGTNGNEDAGNYLAEQFKSLNLLPYSGDSFLVPYKQEIYDTGEQSLQLTKNNQVTTFQHEKDFFETHIGNANVIGEVTVDKKQPTKNKIIAIENFNELSKDRNQTKLIFVKRNPFMKVPRMTQSNTTPMVQVSEEVFKQLTEPNVIVTYKSNWLKKTITANNVIGKLSNGHDHPHEEAIVISAHFDGIGKINNQTVKGTLDNASGVATLLDIVPELSKLGTDYHRDIIIVAFNGEESGLKGSKDFVENLKSTYNRIMNVNIDCVGTSYKVSVLGEAESEYTKFTLDYFNHLVKPDFYMEIGDMVSDHQSFLDAGYEGITFGTVPNEYKQIHTVNDNQPINVNIVEKLSETISKFVQKLEEAEFPSPHAIKSTAFEDCSQINKLVQNINGYILKTCEGTIAENTQGKKVQNLFLDYVKEKLALSLDIWRNEVPSVVNSNEKKYEPIQQGDWTFYFPKFHPHVVSFKKGNDVFWISIMNGKIMKFNSNGSIASIADALSLKNTEQFMKWWTDEKLEENVSKIIESMNNPSVK